MVHANNGSITQDLDSSCLFEFRWTKNVVDASIIDCGIAGCAPKVAKISQDMTVRLAIVFHIVCIEICLVGGFEFKVKVTSNENVGRLRPTLSPIYQSFGIGPPLRGIKRISVGTEEQ